MGVALVAGRICEAGQALFVCVQYTSVVICGCRAQRRQRCREDRGILEHRDVCVEDRNDREVHTPLSSEGYTSEYTPRVYLSVISILYPLRGIPQSSTSEYTPQRCLCRGWRGIPLEEYPSFISILSQKCLCRG